MEPRQAALQFLQAKSAAWRPSVIHYILQKGVPGLMEEFANDPDLSKLCGWFAKPADDVLAGAVDEFLRLQYPLFGEAVTILTQALIDACARRHQLNRQVAEENVALGGTVALILAGLIAGASAGEGG
jgi:hypothetical protein